MLKLKPSVKFASLEIIDIVPTVQGKVFTSEKSNANAKCMLSGQLAETSGYDNFYKPLVDQLKDLLLLVTSS